MNRGGALLVVLWLTAALSAIAFSLASTVRGETERTSTAVESVRAYYLAAGAIERAILYMQWGPGHKLPDGSPRYYSPAMPVMHMVFPTGEASVEIQPETARLNINTAGPDQIARLLAALGSRPERAQSIAEAIVDWRTGSPQATSFDQYYLARTPSFRAPHASFQQIEELLLVYGMTPELYHGTYEMTPEGRLRPAGGLKDCVTVFGANNMFDANTAHPAVLAAAGLSDGAIAEIVARRRAQPFRSDAEVHDFAGGQKLRVGGNSIFTLHATARLRTADGRLSDLRRSVAAQVKLMPPGYDASYMILRWYDQDWRN